MSMMKAVLITQFGGPDVLSHDEVPVPQPRRGRVLVKVSAVGVNYYDTLVRSGAVSRNIALPHVGGSDIVGEIEALGDGVEGWSPGDRVIVAPGYPIDEEQQRHRPENEAPSYYPTGTFEWGGYAQYIEIHARWLLRDDTGLPPHELATIPLVLVTAVHAVKTLGQVGPGSRVLVQAGASGSGSMAIQVAKALGAQVITTVSTTRKAAVASQMGADEIIHYKQAKVADAVREWTHGDGVDVVIDPVGGEAFGDNVQSLRPRGTIVNFGLSGGVQGTIPHLYPFFRNELRILGSWMGSMDELRFGLGLVRERRIKAAIDRVLPLSAAREVHRLVEDHAIAGKVALLPWS
jgi:NADPH2:quinone reductase